MSILAFDEFLNEWDHLAGCGIALEREVAGADFVGDSVRREMRRFGRFRDVIFTVHTCSFGFGRSRRGEAVRSVHTEARKFSVRVRDPVLPGSELSSLTYHDPLPFGCWPRIGLFGPIWSER